LKKIEVNDVRVYWNSESALYIPESLVDETKLHENNIYEAIGADTLHEFMLSPFG
jgi:hypothetical protein